MLTDAGDDDADEVTVMVLTPADAVGDGTIAHVAKFDAAVTITYYTRYVGI